MQSGDEGNYRLSRPTHTADFLSADSLVGDVISMERYVPAHITTIQSRPIKKFEGRPDSIQTFLLANYRPTV